MMETDHVYANIVVHEYGTLSIGRLSRRKERVPFDIAEMIHKLKAA